MTIQQSCLDYTIISNTATKICENKINSCFDCWDCKNIVLLRLLIRWMNSKNVLKCPSFLLTLNLLKAKRFHVDWNVHWRLLNISTCWLLFIGLFEQDGSYFCFWNYSWTKKHFPGKGKIGNFSSRFYSMRLCNSATSYNTVLQHLRI